MRCEVSRSAIAGRVACPASKSYTHRAVFAASLARGRSVISNVLGSEDTDATVRACAGFGASISRAGAALEISGSPEVTPSEIDAGNSGTTARIASAVAGLAAGRSTLDGDASLRTRPMGPLLDALESMGASCTSEDGRPPVTVRGMITGGDVSIPGGVSSQFITALMIAAPLARDGMRIRIRGEPVSRPYIDATISTMEAFGARVETPEPYGEYRIPRRPYRAADFAVPADSSSLALLLSAGVLAGDGVTIDAETGRMPQGDAGFVRMLERLGARTSTDGGAVYVPRTEGLSGGSFDLGDTPDLLPPLSILALKSSDPIEIRNVGHARLKETDRIGILCEELAKTGLDVSERDDGMVLGRSGGLTGADFDSHNDHRLFMAFCIAGMHIGGCTVSDPGSAAVSYPGFVRDMARMGGRMRLEPHKEL